MAEEISPNQTQGPNSESEEELKESDVPDLTDEGLEEVLSEEDPQLAATLLKMGADADLTMEAEGLEVDPDAVAHVVAEEKRSLWYHLTIGRREIPQNFRAWLDQKHTENRDAYFRFKMLSLAKKLQIVLSWIVIMAAVALMGVLLKTRYLTKEEPLFVEDLSTVADQVWKFDGTKELEPFYDNVKVSLHILVIEKIVVNLRPSTNSGRNPMGAFEFYLEGLTNDVLVEAKDREVAVRDIIARTMEGYSFDELDTAEGKRALCNKIKNELDKMLSSGKLRFVRIKTAILKP